MSEENESRPIEARTETEPRPQTEPRPDRERHRRPRRRYPRRRNYNSDYGNSDRESGFNSDPPAESSSDVQTEVASHMNLSSEKVSLKFRGRDLDFFAIRNAISSRRHRIFL